jgi:hypothetical protein
VTPDTPIETYLDELATLGAGLPVRRLRHLLNEAESHLHDAADAERTGGTDEYDAQLRAVARFGPARDLVRGEQRAVTPLRELALQVVRSALLLSGIAAIAVGVSGAVAAAVRAIGGDGSVAAVAPDRALNASDCARWLALHPHAASCRAAAVADWADETVYYRLAAGVAGVLLVTVALVLIRRAGRARALLDPRVVDTIGAGAFGAAAAWTLGMGLDSVAVEAGRGSGQWFSAAPVALAAAAYFAIRLVRELRVQPVMH